LDTVIMAYKIAEHQKVMLPVMVCLDGFTLSHVFEPVDIPEQAKVDSFLSSYRPKYRLDPEKPITVGPISFPDSFMHFKKQQQDAMMAAAGIISSVNSEFQARFKRSYGNGLIDTYRMEDARYAVIAMGTVCGTARLVIDELRKKGKKIGLIKLKCLRPFPKNDLIKISAKLKCIAVIDRDISLGFEGAVYSDVRSALYKSRAIVNGYIMGLGGKDITSQDIQRVAQSLDKKHQSQWVE